MAIRHLRSTVWCLILLSLLTTRSVLAAMTLPAAPGIEVISAEEVMSEHVSRGEAGELLFHDAEGGMTRLISEIGDPEIVNPGDGAFHPAGAEMVLAALEAIDLEFIRDLRVQVYILPYPRAGLLASSASDGAIYISPGVRPLRELHVHFLVAHEIGHAVHRRYLPDGDTAGWRAYQALRGATDSAIYHPHAAHAFRPRELFAEDFRVLFGGAIARGDGTVENRVLPGPEDIAGLRTWFRDLLGPRPTLALSGVRSAPNPVRRDGQVAFSHLPEQLAGGPVEIEFIDVLGRSALRTSLSGASGGELGLSLGGTGRRLLPGAYWVKLSGTVGPPTITSVRILP